MEAVARGEIERMPDVAFRIHIGAGRLRRGSRCKLREVDAAGVDHGKFEQAARGKRLDMGEPVRGVRKVGRPIDVGGLDRRIGRINGNVHLLANALDDARIDLPVEGLRPAAVIGMGVDDGGAGARAGDAFGDDCLDRIRNARLPRPAPGAVQCRLDPDFAHDAASLSSAAAALPPRTRPGVFARNSHMPDNRSSLQGLVICTAAISFGFRGRAGASSARFARRRRM